MFFYCRTFSPSKSAPSSSYKKTWLSTIAIKYSSRSVTSLTFSSSTAGFVSAAGLFTGSFSTAGGLAAGGLSAGAGGGEEWVAADDLEANEGGDGSIGWDAEGSPKDKLSTEAWNKTT